MRHFFLLYVLLVSFLMFFRLQILFGEVFANQLFNQMFLKKCCKKVLCLKKKWYICVSETGN